MALPYQPVDIPLAVGVNTRDDAKLLEVGKLSDLQNVVFEKGRAQRKRFGSTDLGQTTIAASPGTIATGRLLATRDDELVMADASKFYSYSEAADAWADRGAFLSPGVEVDPFADSPAKQTDGDCASAGGITVFAWVDSGGSPDAVYYAVYDSATKAPLHPPTLLASNADRPRVLPVGDIVLVLYHDIASSDLAVKRIAAADLGTSLAASVIPFGYSDVHASTGLDAVSLGTHAVWACRTAGDLVRVGTLLPTGALGGPASGHGYATTGGDLDTDVLAIHAVDGVGCVVYAFDDDVYFQTIEDIEQSAGGPVTLGTPVNLVSSDPEPEHVSCLATAVAGEAHVWWQISSTRVRYAPVSSSTLGSVVTLPRCQLGSHAFYLNDEPVVHVHHDSTLQGTYFLVNAEMYPLARVLGGTAYGPNTSQLPRVTAEDDVYEWCATGKERLLPGTYTEPSIRRVRYDLTANHAGSRALRRGTLYLGGGLVWQYDGESPVESGFLLNPEDYTGTPASGGSMSSSGVYTYAAYWEWYLANGQREQSTAAELLNVTMGGGDTQVTLSIPPLPFTWKRGDRRNVVLALYRSEKNGTARYRVTSFDPATAGDPNGYLENDPEEIGTLSFVDRMGDTTLVTQEPDYQNPSGQVEIANDCPPSLRGLRNVQDRMWGVSNENRRRAYFSKLGKELTAVEWSEANYVEAPDDLVGIAELQGQVVLVGESKVWLVRGEGPDNLGNGVYGRAEELSPDVGCADPRTLVSMPLGEMFLTSKGIWLLGRNFQLVYVGGDVAAYNDQTFTGAELVADANEVRFLTNDGRTVVYNYERGAWSTFTRVEGVSSTIWRGVYCHLSDDGLVRKESAAYRDSGNGISQSSTTGWIQPAGPNRYMRVRRAQVLGNYKSSCRLRVEVGYNYEDQFRENFIVDPSDFISSATWGDGGTWGSDAVWGGDGATNVFRFRHKLKHPKCSAVRFRFTELPGDDAGEGLELNVLTLEVGIKGGTARLAQNRTV